MTPSYEVRVWREDDWWLARVVGASPGADQAPLNALTQARSLTKIESMARDLIATVLDTNEADFEVELQYILPDDLREIVWQAKGARAWLDAAQDLWHERSTAAARALTSGGYSLREAAILLGMSHQRVDQLLASQDDPGRNRVLIFECKTSAPGESGPSYTPDDSHELDALLVVRHDQMLRHGHASDALGQDMEAQFREHVRALVATMSRHAARSRQ
jgi:hypothetical protein